MVEIVLKHQAIERGLKRYYTGKVCKHGHVCERPVVNGTCIECQYAGVTEWCKKIKIGLDFYRENVLQKQEKIQT